MKKKEEINLNLFGLFDRKEKNWYMEEDSVGGI